MKKYKWKQYSNTVAISKCKGSLVEVVAAKIEEVRTCFDHQICRSIGSSFYRSYRRGKNRCNKCGSKLNG